MTAAGLLLLGVVAGMVVVEFCIHRPDRAVKEMLHAADLAAKDDIIAAKTTTIDTLETRADVMTQSADEAWRRYNDLREKFDRGYLLPTIDGNRLDRLDLQETLRADGWRIDFADTADVVSLDRRRGR